MRLRWDSSKGQFILFVLLTLFLIAQVSWWIIFQIRSGERHTELQESLWARQVETAMLWASTHHASHEDFATFLARSFPDLVLDDRSVPRVSFGARAELKKETGRAVRMFLYEGTFYSTILVAGIFFMYWTLRRELSFERRQSSFLSAISHELKTPITALRLYSETLDGPKLDETQRAEVLGSMRENLDRLSSLIDRLLQARAMLHVGGESEVVTVNLAEETEETARRLVEPLRDLYGVELSSDLENTVRVRIDPEHWRIIVTNLLENAAKYSRDGGEVRMVLEKSHHQAVFSVHDNGVGFPRHETKRIFKRFYRIGSEDTRTTSGSGLGLYLVSELVRQHRGRVRAQSPGVGQGATFTVYLPLS